MSAAPAIETGGQLRLVGADGQEIPQLRPKLSQFFTPAWLAEAMAELAAVYLRDRSFGAPRILEPSAGNGALVGPLLEKVPGAQIIAVELDVRFRPALARLQKRGAVLIDVCDYTTRPPSPLRRYDLAVSNPPWTDGAAGPFLRKAQAECEAVLIHCPGATEHSAERDDIFTDPDWGTAVRITHPDRLKYTGPGGKMDTITLLRVRGWTGPCILLRWREGDTPMPERIESPVEAAQRALWRMYCEHIDHAGSDPVSLGEVSGIRHAAQRLERDLSEAGDRPVDPDHAGHPRPRRETARG